MLIELAAFLLGLNEELWVVARIGVCETTLGSEIAGTECGRGTCAGILATETCGIGLGAWAATWGLL